MDFSVDLEKSKFDKLIVTEEIFNNEYEYKISYDVTIYFKDFDCGEKSINRIMKSNPSHKTDRFAETYKERPEFLSSKVISKQDDEEGTVDNALADYIDYECKSTASKLQFLVDAFNINIPEEIASKAVNGRIELSDLGKLRFVEFNYKKAEVKNLILKYGDSDDDVTTYTVELRNGVTNDDVDEFIPGKSLLYLYNHVYDWLQDEYDYTIEILNNIFKIDFRTLKGCTVL